MKRLFRPSCVLTMGAVVFSDLNIPLGPRGPRIAFRVKRTLNATPDEASFEVYNLDPKLEKAAASVFGELGTLPVTISAGYEGSVSRIFAGDLRSPLVVDEPRGADFVLAGRADDAGDAISELTINTSTAGVTVEVMIQTALAAINAGDPTRGILPYPLAKHQSVDATVALLNPQARSVVFSAVYAGKVRDLLNEAARLCEARWWVADGLLYMAKAKLPVDGLAVAIPEQNWLSRPGDAGGGLVSFSAFFDPMIVPGRIVQVIQGVSPYSLGVGVQAFRCEEVEVIGDTRGAEPWRANMLLRRFS